MEGLKALVALFLVVDLAFRVVNWISSFAETLVPLAFVVVQVVESSTRLALNAFVSETVSVGDGNAILARTSVDLARTFISKVVARITSRAFFVVMGST